MLLTPQNRKHEAFSQLESRRQPRASNASLSSLTVSCRPASSSSSLSQAPANGGRGVAGAVYGDGPSPATCVTAPGDMMQQPPAFGRGRAIYLSVMASGGGPTRIGRPSSVAASASTHDPPVGSNHVSATARLID